MTNRVVLVETDNVNQDTLWKTICSITAADDQMNNSDPIYLAFNSGGGDGLYGLGLYYFIKGFKRDIISVNINQCSSSVILPYLSCSERLSLPKAVFGIHQPYKEVNGSIIPLDDSFHKLQKQLLPKHPSIEMALSQSDPITNFEADDLFSANMIVTQIISLNEIFPANTIVASIKDNEMRLGGCYVDGVVSY